jgi:hypothetical protein
MLEARCRAQGVDQFIALLKIAADTDWSAYKYKIYTFTLPKYDIKKPCVNHYLYKQCSKHVDFSVTKGSRFPAFDGIHPVVHITIHR